MRSGMRKIKGGEYEKLRGLSEEVPAIPAHTQPLACMGWGDRLHKQLQGSSTRKRRNRTKVTQ